MPVQVQTITVIGGGGGGDGGTQQGLFLSMGLPSHKPPSPLKPDLHLHTGTFSDLSQYPCS